MFKLIVREPCDRDIPGPEEALSRRGFRHSLPRNTPSPLLAIYSLEMNGLSH